MSSEQYEASLQAMIAQAWEKLSISQREIIARYADWFAHRNRLSRGPFDGLLIDYRFLNADSVAVQLDSTRIAHYKWDDSTAAFVYFRNYEIGAESGRQPDISSDELMIQCTDTK